MRSWAAGIARSGGSSSAWWATTRRRATSARRPSSRPIAGWASSACAWSGRASEARRRWRCRAREEEQGDVMDCEAFRDDMLDVLYGEGGEAAARRLEAHQTTCADCRREMAQLRELRGDLAHWRLPEGLVAA